MRYQEEDYLLLSGLQHFAFCKRQWALIHVEQQWAENYRTTDGKIMHERAHDEAIRDKRKDFFAVRGLRVSSADLGISGQCDIVEYYADTEGIPLIGHEGKWRPYPVEYKRGHSKEIDSDRLQLCAQAMCLEEMLCCEIPEGAIFYKETKRRERVLMTEEIRNQVKTFLKEMHQYYERGHTPQVRRTKSCNACSLKELCLPQIGKTYDITGYMKRITEGIL